MKSYQTCWTIYTSEVGPVSSSAFVMASSPAQAKSITRLAIKNTFSTLTSLEFHRTFEREPGYRYPGHYITATSNLESECSGCIGCNEQLALIARRTKEQQS